MMPLSDARVAGLVVVRAIEHSGRPLAEWLSPGKPPKRPARAVAGLARAPGRAADRDPGRAAGWAAGASHRRAGRARGQRGRPVDHGAGDRPDRARRSRPATGVPLSPGGGDAPGGGRIRILAADLLFSGDAGIL